MKIKVILLNVFLLVFFILPSWISYGEKTETHWASEAVENLRHNGIVSGDENGDLRLESNITRAEFVKVINKSFAYYLTSSDNFPDVVPEAWYYNEFLIAKKAGYITGNEMNYANPEKEITREEAGVILARVLCLDCSQKENVFNDSIADWAIGSINALKAKGIINGYTDGTFGGSLSVKRAEAFQMIYLARNQKIAENNSPNEESSSGMQTVIKEPVISSNGGNSGAGGISGGSSGDKKVKVPTVIRYDAESEILVIGSVKNAASYRIRIDMDGTVYDLEVSDPNAQKIELGEKLKEITASIQDVKVEFDISVMAVAKEGYKDSAFSSKIHAVKRFESLETPVLQLKTAVAGGRKHAIIVWETIEDAASYEIKAKVGDIDFTDYIYNADKNEVRLDDLSSLIEQEACFSVRAISEDNSIIRSSDFAEISVSGKTDSKVDADGYYCVSNEEEFIYAVENCTKIKLENSIALGDEKTLRSWIPVFFEGELNGNNKTITIYTDTTTSGTGIFSVIQGNVKIYDLIICGTVKSTQGNTGALAGDLKSATVNSQIINITNYADVTSTSSGGTTIGGIIGNMSSWNGHRGILSNLYNHGSVVNGGTYAGGIVGMNRGNLSFCANFGKVTSKAPFGHAGGISARNYETCKISQCYNMGEICANYNAGGIIGVSNYGTLTVENCYNTGSILSESGGGIAGLTKGDTASIPQTNILYSYHTGMAKNPISVCGDFLKVSDCCYLSENAEDDNLEGTFPVTSAEFADKSNPVVEKLLQNGFEYPEGASYPQITGNLERIWRIYEGVQNISAVREAANLIFKWNNPTATDAEKLIVSVYDNTDILSVCEEKILSSEEESFEISDINPGNYYEIYITVYYSDGTLSDTVSYEFKAE